MAKKDGSRYVNKECKEDSKGGKWSMVVFSL